MNIYRAYLNCLYCMHFFVLFAAEFAQYKELHQNDLGSVLRVKNVRS